MHVISRNTVSSDQPRNATFLLIFMRIFVTRQWEWCVINLHEWKLCWKPIRNINLTKNIHPEEFNRPPEFWVRVSLNNSLRINTSKSFIRSRFCLSWDCLWFLNSPYFFGLWNEVCPKEFFMVFYWILNFKRKKCLSNEVIFWTQIVSVIHL